MTVVHRGSGLAGSPGFSLLLGVGKACVCWEADGSDQLNLPHPSKTLLWALSQDRCWGRERSQTHFCLLEALSGGRQGHLQTTTGQMKECCQQEL